MVKKDQLYAIYCTQEEKLNFESFSQSGCYGDQPQPPEVVFYSTDANFTSSSFTKQDLIVKRFDCQATLNFRKFKVALNPMYRFFLNFAKSCVLTCLSNVGNIKKFHRAIF